MKEIIEKLDLSPHLRMAYEKMAESFMDLMPDSLYMTYYDLARRTGTSVETWEQFLDHKEIEQFIESKIVKLTEVNARAALHKLANNPDITTTEVQALKELIAKSKLIQQSKNQKPQIILTHIPLD